MALTAERAARWLLHARRPPFDIAETIDFFAGGVLAVGKGLPSQLAGRDLAGYEDRRKMFAGRGVPGCGPQLPPLVVAGRVGQDADAADLPAVRGAPVRSCEGR